MAAIAARSRRRSRGGTLQWAALGGATLVILGLTFGLGIFVGRQWAHPTSIAAPTEPARKTATPRRGGLTEPAPERASDRQEKLTFYQTLTAPLGAVPSSAPEAAPKPSASKPRADAPPERAAAATADKTRADAGGDAHRAASAEWTVQVGVFKSAEQAERVRKQLADARFSAHVAPMTGDDGPLRYRVRVGGFKTKDEAVKMAEQVRADRSLPTFVTVK